MDFEDIKNLPSEDLIHALIVQMDKEELYNKAVALKQNVVDPEKYHMYIVMSANKGYQLAKDEFYDYYYTQLSSISGKPYPIDVTKAKKFYEHTKEYSYSALLLGELYGKRLTGDEDYVTAKELYELAIEYDDKNTFAYDNIALMYDHGLGVEPDEKMSRKYSRMSETKKSPYSVYRAACFVFEQDEGKKWRQAEKMFKECISMDSSYKDKSVAKLLEIYNMRYTKNRLKEQIINYFIEIEETDKLKDLYNYDDNAIHIMKQNGLLKKEAAEIDVGVYFKSLMTVPSNVDQSV